MKDLNEIAKNGQDSYDYAESLHFKNVPYIIIKSISKNSWKSYQYAYSLNFKNVPLIIIKSALKYYYYEVIEDFPENKQFLIYMLQYDKRMNILI